MRNDIYTLTSEASQAATVFLNVIYAVSNGESGKTKSVNYAPDEQTKTLVALALDPNQLGEDPEATFSQETSEQLVRIFDNSESDFESDSESE